MLLDEPPAWPDGVQVLAVDLNVREGGSAEARQAAESAARKLGTRARLFLKIDSTLRGPIGALVEGALDGSQHARAVVAPAFPEQGRLFHGGWLYIDGQRTQAHLAGALGEVAPRCDLDDGADLDAIAEAWPARLLVGSGGLARRVAGPGRAQALPTSEGPVLVVAGSPSQATQRQLEQLPPHLEVLRTPPTDERDAGEAAATLAQEVLGRTRAARPGLLVLTGGQTARIVCSQLGALGVHLLGEVLPGLPVGRLRGGVWDGLLVVTKAGGFGGPAALLDALRALSPSSLDTP
jgi:uncharacterized protein YgbK (DUF1537 family)